MIQIENLSKTYKTSAGGFTALSDVNLTVNDGEIFGIIGLSGAGKSTLVRCINFLEVLKNICFPLEIAKVPKEQAVKRARELLELVGLADKESSYPSQLSGGQKQRVAIARALAAETKYLLCDEATSALDPDTTRSILDLLKKVNKELGVTIIVITHEMKVIESICDRAAVLDGGNVAELAPVSELFANPKSDIARKLILPAVNTAEEIKGGRVIRIIFDGETSYKPIIANLILSCQAPLNILKADTQDVGGKAFGQIIIGLPDDEVLAERVTKYLDDNGIKFSETEAV